nr:molybdopterin-dependent oxidoreductase [Propionibacteriales bacterium]
LPNLLPGGRPLSAASARVDLAATWGLDLVSSTAGRDVDEILAATTRGEISGLVVGGVEVDDLADPAAGLAALDAADFVVSLEVRASAVTARADVILPVAPVEERAGSFVDWEGRVRPFARVLESNALNDIRVLSGIADELARPLGVRTVAEVRTEMQELGPWDGERTGFTSAPTPADGQPLRDGEMILSTWRMLIDDARAVDGEPHLMATARRPAALLSTATLARLGVAPAERVRVSTDAGSVSLPVAAADIADDTVWLPANSGGVRLNTDLLARAGSVVRVERDGP